MSNPIKVNLNQQYYLVDNGDGLFVPEIDTDDYLTDINGKRVTEDDPGLQKMMSKLGIKTFEEIHVRPFVSYVRTLLARIDDLKTRPDPHLIEDRIRSIVQAAHEAYVDYGSSSALVKRVGPLISPEKSYLIHLIIGEEFASHGREGYWASLTLAHGMAKECGIDVADRANRAMRRAYTNAFNRQVNKDNLENSSLGEERPRIFNSRLHFAKSYVKGVGVDGKPIFSPEEQSAMLGEIVDVRRHFYRKDIENLFYYIGTLVEGRPKEWRMKMDMALTTIIDSATTKVPKEETYVFDDEERQGLLARARDTQREGLKVYINILVRRAMKRAKERGDGWLQEVNTDLSAAAGVIQAIAVSSNKEIFPEKARLVALAQVDKIRRDIYREEINRCWDAAVRLRASEKGEEVRQRAKGLVERALKLVDSTVGLSAASVFDEQERTELKAKLNLVLR